MSLSPPLARPRFEILCNCIGPVCGSLDGRSCFSFTENFPKPVMSTSSPFCRDCFISSKRASVTWSDWVLVKMFWAKSAWMMLALVRVIDGSRNLNVGKWGMRDDTAGGVGKQGWSGRRWRESIDPSRLGDLLLDCQNCGVMKCGTEK